MTKYYPLGLQYIRARFKVPARRGSRVEFKGRLGSITGSEGDHVTVRFDGEQVTLRLHPTELNYVEAGEVSAQLLCRRR